MSRILRSLGYALEGLHHALMHERNLLLFVIGYATVLVLSATLMLERWEWIALLINGSAFMTIELFNTALERLTDAVDALPKETGNATLHRSMKAAKDVSAAAALIGFATVAVMIVVIVGPKIV